MCVCVCRVCFFRSGKEDESLNQSPKAILTPSRPTPTSSEFSFKGNMADSRIVPRFSGSKENLWKNVEFWGVIVSADLTPDFKLDLKPKAKLPYQRQEAPVFYGPKAKPPASAGRLPLAPLAPLIVPSDDAPNVGDVFDEVSSL